MTSSVKVVTVLAAVLCAFAIPMVAFSDSMDADDDLSSYFEGGIIPTDVTLPVLGSFSISLTKHVDSSELSVSSTGSAYTTWWAENPSYLIVNYLNTPQILTITVKGYTWTMTFVAVDTTITESVFPDGLNSGNTYMAYVGSQIEIRLKELVPAGQLYAPLGSGLTWSEDDGVSVLSGTILTGSQYPGASVSVVCNVGQHYLRIEAYNPWWDEEIPSDMTVEVGDTFYLLLKDHVGSRISITGDSIGITQGAYGNPYRTLISGIVTETGTVTVTIDSISWTITAVEPTLDPTPDPDPNPGEDDVPPGHHPQPDYDKIILVLMIIVSIAVMIIVALGITLARKK